MVSLPIAQSEIPSEMRALLRCLAAAAAVTTLADWLFYLHRPGISVVIFAGALAAAALATNKVRATRTELALATAVLVVSLLPATEDFGLLALAFAAAGAAAFVLLASGWQARDGLERMRDLAARRRCSARQAADQAEMASLARHDPVRGADHRCWRCRSPACSSSASMKIS
jgi:hypothetical protein